MNESILDFLSQLQLHNEREWFQANKPLYEKARKEYETFLDELIPGIAKFDDSVKFLTGKECTFRIFRDVRFAKDKSPYKINFGAWMAKGGRKNSGPGYYVHIQPGESFLAGGVYMPDPAVLKKIRQEIFYNAGEFKKILNDPKMKKLFGGMDDFEKQKLAPKGFPKEFPDIDLLKNKHFIVSQAISDKEISAKDFLKKALITFETMKKFQDFLRRAVEV